MCASNSGQAKVMVSDLIQTQPEHINRQAVPAITRPLKHKSAKPSSLVISFPVMRYDNMDQLAIPGVIWGGRLPWL
jgi:hypothetical protein